MENQVQQFLSDIFGEVRVEKENNTIWFCAPDIAKILNYASTQKVTEKVDDEDKGQRRWLTLGGEQEITCINESGLYQVILSVTKKDNERYKKAREFKRWVAGTVIPTIRKDGAYISGEEKLATGELSEEEFILKAMTIMQNKIERLTKENAEMKPKVDYHDKVLQPTTYKKLITTTEIAKDLGMTAQSLNKKLNEIKFIFKDKNGVWCLYKDYQHLIPEYADYTINEHGQTLKYTEQGRKYIISLLQTIDN